MKKSKKVLSLLLAIIMMFSITSVSYAATPANDSSATTLSDYIDQLQEKVKNENIFVRIISKVIILCVNLGFMQIEDFEEWVDRFAPITDNNNTEDITELKLDSSQSLPYTEGNITIKNMKIIKEDYDGTYINKHGRPVKTTYRHKIIIDGDIFYDSYALIGIQLFSTKDPTIQNTFYLNFSSNSFSSYYELGTTTTPMALRDISYSIENNTFNFECYMYSVSDKLDGFYIYELFAGSC